jgi:hypothetical protein
MSTAKKHPKPFGDYDPYPTDDLVVGVYLGMGTDIMGFMNLVPDFDVLFVIDNFDEAFSRTGDLDGQRDEIIEILKEGKKKTYNFSDDTMNLRGMPVIEKAAYHYLTHGKCEILMDARYQKRAHPIAWDWRLRFKYNGKERCLMSFNRDFYGTWPKGIRNAKHVMMMGSSSFPAIADELSKEERERFGFNLDHCMHRRGYRLYALSFNHAFPHHVVVDRGIEARGTCVAYIDIFPRKGFITNVIEKVLKKEDTHCTLNVMSTGKVYNVRWFKSRVRLD